MKANDIMRNEAMEEKKEERRTQFLTTLICLLPIIAGVILYNKIPEQIVTHWDANGNPNGWSSRFTGIIIFPGSLAVLNLVFPLLLKTDPRYKNMGSKPKKLMQWIIPLVAVFCSGTTLGNALGYDTPVEKLGPIFMALIFIIVGNYLPKMGQSYTMGIKLPWTLASEENWEKTHHMAGFLWVIGGVLFFAASFFPFRNAAYVVILVTLILVPTVYSYLLFRKNGAD